MTGFFSGLCSFSYTESTSSPRREQWKKAEHSGAAITGHSLHLPGKPICKTRDSTWSLIGTFNQSRADWRSYHQRPTSSLLWFCVFSWGFLKVHTLSQVSFQVTWQAHHTPGLPSPLTGNVSIKMQSCEAQEENARRETSRGCLVLSLIQCFVLCELCLDIYISFKMFIQQNFNDFLDHVHSHKPNTIWFFF